MSLLKDTVTASVNALAGSATLRHIKLDTIVQIAAVTAAVVTITTMSGYVLGMKVGMGTRLGRCIFCGLFNDSRWRVKFAEFFFRRATPAYSAHLVPTMGQAPTRNVCLAWECPGQ